MSEAVVITVSLYPINLVISKDFANLVDLTLETTSSSLKTLFSIKMTWNLRNTHSKKKDKPWESQNQVPIHFSLNFFLRKYHSTLENLLQWSFNCEALRSEQSLFFIFRFFDMYSSPEHHGNPRLHVQLHAPSQHDHRRGIHGEKKRHKHYLHQHTIRLDRNPKKRYFGQLLLGLRPHWTSRRPSCWNRRSSKSFRGRNAPGKPYHSVNSSRLPSQLLRSVSVEGGFGIFPGGDLAGYFTDGGEMDTADGEIKIYC